MARDHVPTLELRLPVSLGMRMFVRPLRMRDDVDDRVGMDEARTRLDGPDRIHGRDGGAGQLHLQLVPPAPREGIEIGRVAPAPGEKRDLVHRTVERHRVGLVPNQAGGRGRESGEAIDEGGPPDVEVVGPAVMQQVPEHLRPGLAGGAEHGQEARPVVASGRGLDQMPSQAVPHRADRVARERPIVQGRVTVVADGGDHVEAAAVLPSVCRGFDPTLEEALEQRRRRRGPPFRQDRVEHRLPLRDDRRDRIVAFHLGAERGTRVGAAPPDRR